MLIERFLVYNERALKGLVLQVGDKNVEMIYLRTYLIGAKNHLDKQ